MEIALLLAIGIGAFWYIRKLNKGNYSENSRYSPETTSEYAQKMGQFKDVTLDYIVNNYGPIKGLSKETTMYLLAYLVDASSSACRYAGIDERYKGLAHLALLKQMGIHDEGAAQGMLAALSNPLPAGKELLFDQGGSAFNAWIREGDVAAQNHIRDAMAIWQSTSGIADEIAAYGNPSNNPRNK